MLLLVVAAAVTFRREAAEDPDFASALESEALPKLKRPAAPPAGRARTHRTLPALKEGTLTRKERLQRLREKQAELREKQRPSSSANGRVAPRKAQLPTSLQRSQLPTSLQRAREPVPMKDHLPSVQQPVPMKPVRSADGPPEDRDAQLPPAAPRPGTAQLQMDSDEELARKLRAEEQQMDADAALARKFQERPSTAQRRQIAQSEQLAQQLQEEQLAALAYRDRGMEHKRYPTAQEVRRGLQERRAEAAKAAKGPLKPGTWKPKRKGPLGRVAARLRRKKRAQ